MIQTVALLARLEAKPGKEEEVSELLTEALSFAESEPATKTWFALRFGPTSFGIFDTFSDEEGRQAHLNGLITKTLMEHAPDLLAEPPSIESVDIIRAKRV